MNLTVTYVENLHNNERIYNCFYLGSLKDQDYNDTIGNLYDESHYGYINFWSYYIPELSFEAIHNPYNYRLQQYNGNKSIYNNLISASINNHALIKIDEYDLNMYNINYYNKHTRYLDDISFQYLCEYICFDYNIDTDECRRYLIIMSIDKSNNIYYIHEIRDTSEDTGISLFFVVTSTFL